MERSKSHFSDIFPGLNDPQNDQNFGDGYGVKLSLQFNRKLSNNYGVSIEPYISYWDIDKSDLSTVTLYGVPIGYVVEPENETTGIWVAIKFHVLNYYIVKISVDSDDLTIAKNRIYLT